jgi:hypothetical protein
MNVSQPSGSGEAKRQQKRVSLSQWVRVAIALPQARVQTRIRGNNLHILVEAATCPDSKIVLPRLIRALTKIRLERLLPPDQPPIYQVLLYGRKIGVARPIWTEAILLNQLDRYLARLQSATPSNAPPASHASDASALVLSNQSLARQGKVDAIARYLSETLSNFGISVKVNAKTILLEGERKEESGTKATVSGQSTAKRLSITCESAYSPDPTLIAEPIAQRLRSLQLQGFQDALIVTQVQGEAKPDWLLRVDLTPREEMLREWGRWGDVQAIAHLLNLALADQKIQVSAVLKDLTLHITCTLAQPEQVTLEKPQTMPAIAALLESIAPQGIHAATVYGFQRCQPSDPQQVEAPLWVDWLDLPASIHPALAPSTLALAQQGDRDAITFLLTRLLNENLNTYLATGGIHVQVLKKDDLLHIMTDAPICPKQRQISKPIARLLSSLQLADVQGIRVYGRRSGQKRPFWSYGVDFGTRDRIVPEAIPEFAASDAYVGDLIAKPGALVVRSEVKSDTLQTRLGQWLQQISQETQQLLLRSKLFSLETATTPLKPQTEEQERPIQEANPKLAVVWVALGALLTLQADWLLGQLLRSPAPDAATAAAQSAKNEQKPNAEPTLNPLGSPDLPKLSLRKSPGNQENFNSEGFTGTGSVSVIVEDGTGKAANAQVNSAEMVTENGTKLSASPLQPLAAALPEPGSPGASPTFNSRQLDEKIKLYRDRLAISGRPDVLVIGSSRALRGIDPVALEKALAAQGYRDIDVFNFGINGATAQVVDLIVRDILTPEELPKLILWADGARAFNSGRLDVTYNGIVASAGYKQLSQTRPSAATATAETANTSATTAGVPTASPTNSYQVVNQQLNQLVAKLSTVYPQRSQLKTVFQEKLSGLLPNPQSALPPQTLLTQDGTSQSKNDTNSLPSEGKSLIDINGFLPLSNRFNPVTYYQKYARVPGDYDGDYESFALQGEQIDALTSLVQFTQNQQITLAFINLPLTESYLDAVRQNYETQFQQEIRSQATQQKFIYLDLSRNWLNENNFFSDPSHLNRYGAYAVSQALAQSAMLPWGSIQKSTDSATP